MQSMEHRTLGKTDLKVSRLALGTMTFGGQVTEAEAIRMVDRCLDHGVNLFDTANVYNQGKSEIILGQALRGRRHRAVLATKVCGKMGEEPDDVGLKRSAIRKAIDASLKRLGTDYVDLYYLHQPDRETRIEEALGAMEELVREGKIRYPAVSNYAAWQMVQILWHCTDRGFVLPIVSQLMYSLLARGIEQECVACCREYGIGIIAYNPLAGGLLTGKHLQRSGPAPGTRFDGNKMYQDRYWHPACFDAVDEVAAIATRAGMTMIALAYRWLLAQPGVDCVLLGASGLDQLEENLKACAGPQLDPDVAKECNAVWEKLRGVTPTYNR